MSTADWAAAVARQPLDVAARLVAGQLADRAGRGGRVRVTAGELAASTCLTVTAVDTALAVLASYQLVARDDRHLVLVVPGRTPEGR